MSKELQYFYTWAVFSFIAAMVAIYFIVSLIQSKQDNLVFGSQEHVVRNNGVVETVAGFGPEVVKESAVVSYEEIRNNYEGRRIQLDNCVLLPNNATYKNNTKVMLDNRSNEPTEIRLDGKVFRLWGYEYQIVAFYHPDVPHTVDIDCQYLGQDQYNVGRVLLQP